MIHLSDFFAHIPGMLVHNFQRILNFLYVCQSFTLLISLLKLDKYKRLLGQFGTNETFLIIKECFILCQIDIFGNFFYTYDFRGYLVGSLSNFSVKCCTKFHEECYKILAFFDKSSTFL